jgi:hypothetical protein
VKQDRFQILENAETRKDNVEFMDAYGLNYESVKEVLLKLEVSDFCYGLKSVNLGNVGEVLYVFCPQVGLVAYGVSMTIGVYTKLSIEGGDWVVVVSFHERNKPITYLFN